MVQVQITVPNFLRRLLPSGTEAGVARVVSGRAGMLIERQECLEFRPAQSSDTLRVQIEEHAPESDGRPSLYQVKVSDDRRGIYAGPIGLRADAMSEYAAWRRRLQRMTGRMSLRRRAAWGVAVATAVVIALPLLGRGGAGAGLAAAQESAALAQPYAPQIQLAGVSPQAPAPSASVPSVSAPSADPRPTHLDAASMQALRSAHAVDEGGAVGGKPTFYAFESTTCSHCQDLDSQMPAIAKSYAPQVILLGFDPVARTQASEVYCSAHPAQTLHAEMTGLGSQAKPCQAGYAAVDANDTIFVKLGFISTPTLVTQSGHVAVGAGTADTVVGWLNKN